MLGNLASQVLVSSKPQDEYKHSYASKPKFEIPEDFDDEISFLSTMRKDFYDDVQYDRLNREAALEDTRFMVSDQWDEISRQRREAARKPCLTINRLPAFVSQVVGQRRMNETSIKIVPDNGGTVQIARVREGLMRSIQKITRAELAFDKALENQVICGIGNFQVELDYESDDVFDQEIRITAINDALAVVWDRMLNDPTGADARHVFLIDTMTKKDFYRLWPWATASDVVTDVTLRGDLRMNGWIAIDDVRVVSYWRMRTRKRTKALMLDGSVEDITDTMEGDNDDEKNATLANIAQRADSTPIMREVDERYAQMYLCSGLDILEGPYDLPIKRVPIFRVPGWEVNVGEWKHRWGIIRFLKDPQRLHNYWRSVVAEKIMQTPRAVWVAPDTAVAGRENQWRNSHLSDDPLLIWNADSGQKPERVMPAQMEESLLGESQLTVQDMKDVSNIHEANLGMPSNEVSGAAIVARQRVSDFGTILYHDNLTKSIEQCGTVINDLIPYVYDTPRVIKVLGIDAKQDLQVINAMDNPTSIDIGLGRYSVTATTAASYATKRVEAAEHMMTLINAAPQIAPLILDLLILAQDWPMAEEISKRWRKTLPPGILDPKDMTPEEQQGMAQQQQAAGQKEQLALQTAVAEYMKTQSEAALNAARAQSFNAQAQATPAKVQTEAMGAASQAADRELRGRLEAVRVADGH